MANSSRSSTSSSPTADSASPRSARESPGPFGYWNYTSTQQSDLEFKGNVVRTLESAGEQFGLLIERSNSTQSVLEEMKIRVIGVENGLRGVQNGMTGLQAEMGQLGNRITTLQNEVTGLKTQVGGLANETRGNHTAVGMDIRNTESELKDTINEKINEAEERLTARFDEKLNEVEKRLTVSFDDKLNGLEDRLNKRIDGVKDEFKHKFAYLTMLLETRLPPPPSGSALLHQPTPVPAPIEGTGGPSVPAIQLEGEMGTVYKEITEAIEENVQSAQRSYLNAEANVSNSQNLQSSIHKLGLKLRKSMSNIKGNKSPASPTSP